MYFTTVTDSNSNIFLNEKRIESRSKCERGVIPLGLEAQ